ncbi:AAA family ATPase, partial [Paraburkholderia sp. EG285A]
MNATDPALQDEAPLGLYTRGAGRAREWWRVSPSERAHMYRIEHGQGEDGGVDIDTEIDLDNLEAKLLKWRREGFVSEAQRADEARATQAGSTFSAALQRAVEAAREAKATQARPQTHTPAVQIGTVDLPRGEPNALVPRINAAYLFTERGNDIVQDIVENRRVMLIGHTGSGKTSFIEQVAAR